MAQYVIVMRDDRYWLVGPFETHDSMRGWERWEYEHGEDTRWQSIELSGDRLLPMLRGPDFHPEAE